LLNNNNNNNNNHDDHDDDKNSTGLLYKHETLENSKETDYVFVGNTDCNISPANGAPITIKGKWRLKCKRFVEGVHGTFPGPLDPRTLLYAASTYQDT
jgi:hypothetical protein